MWLDTFFNNITEDMGRTRGWYRYGAALDRFFLS